MVSEMRFAMVHSSIRTTAAVVLCAIPVLIGVLQNGRLQDEINEGINN